ncbi:MAG: InlB B-repeat-containing protein [Clostridia bacterium]|nr:InlB B-repeat-containing protein [Clostridia bacterium]
MNICKGKKASRIIGFLTAIALIASAIMIPLQSVFAADPAGTGATAKTYTDAQDLTKGSWYALPGALENYLESGKMLEFDLKLKIAEGVITFRFADADKNYTSTSFQLKDGSEGIEMETTDNGDGWFHYAIRLSTVPHTEPEEGEEPYFAATQFRVMTSVPAGSKIANLKYEDDIMNMPEAFVDDYDIVTLEDLGFTGTDYKTEIFSGRYTFDAKSETHSEIVKFGWESHVSDEVDWKIALDTYWNATCMAWFRNERIYFCPGDNGSTQQMFAALDPITSGRHDIEFGRLRVIAGPNTGKDYVFLKIDGEIKADAYTNYYQTPGGYVAHNGGEITQPNNMVCFVGDGVSKQRFSGFGKPDEYVSDIDVVNIGDIMKPATVIKNTKGQTELGKLYSYKVTSKTRSTVAKFVLKTGNNTDSLEDGSNMVVDIGGNCGFCRSYIAAGNHSSVMFAWEFEECTEGTKAYKFESNNWYAFEQGRKRVTAGAHKGQDLVYLMINGEMISSFYVNAGSRPPVWDSIYIEANDQFEIYGYNELAVKYYNEDGSLYLNQMGQKGFTAHKPADPKAEGKYFLGWYTAKTGGTKFDFKNTKLTANTNLYAHFTKDTATATFNAANGNNPTAMTVGKNSLFKAPADPTKIDPENPAKELVFTGWKNETTGKIFNFETDTISADTTFTAQYTEKKYYVSYYANGKLVKKVAFTKTNPKVTDPAVPAVANMTGVWESHPTTNLTGGMTVNAIYNGKKTTASSAISLTAFKGGGVYLNTDVIHEYLSTNGFANQTTYMRDIKTMTPNLNSQHHQTTSLK